MEILESVKLKYNFNKLLGGLFQIYMSSSKVDCKKEVEINEDEVNLDGNEIIYILLIDFSSIY